MAQMVKSGKGKGLTKRQLAFGTGLANVVSGTIDPLNRRVNAGKYARRYK